MNASAHTQPACFHPVLRPRPTFLVGISAQRELPTPEQLEHHARRFIMRELGGWLQLSVDERITSGRVEWIVDASGPRAGERVIAVRCDDRPGPRRPGLWAALYVAHALAELLDGWVADPRRGVSSPRARLRPPADGRVRVIDHLCVPSSRCHAGLVLGSVGMAQFGLPELELELASAHEPPCRGRHMPCQTASRPGPSVARGLCGAKALRQGAKAPAGAMKSMSMVERGASLLLGVAQHLIDAGWSPPRAGDGQRELLLTVSELHWAVGGEADATPIINGRGWTRVAVELDDRHAWPGVLRLRPPSGARRWPDTGAWMRDAWSDLFGP